MAEGDEIAGEADLIGLYLAPLAGDLPGAFGLTDDCAALTPRPGYDLVLTTDTVAEGVHFLPDDTPQDIAWKALAVNVSDLTAKGATPLVYLLSLALPEVPTPGFMRGLADGLDAAQTHFGIRLTGGDTDRRPGPLTLSIAAIGEVPCGRMVRRATAAPGDRLYVSGVLGDAAIGLRLRRSPSLCEAWSLTPDEVSHLRHRYARPAPPTKLARVLLDHARAAMDISDGLAKDLGRMASASGTGARIALRRLPLSGAVQRALAVEPSLIEAVVSGGDDYEVLAAVPPDAAASYEREAASAGVAVTHIGEITSNAGVVIEGPDGAPLQLQTTGWDHF